MLRNSLKKLLSNYGRNAGIADKAFLTGHLFVDTFLPLNHSLTDYRKSGVIQRFITISNL